MAEGESELTGAARFLAANRARVQSVRAVCGQSIEGTARRTYCSNRCAARAYRKRTRSGVATPDTLQRLDRLREIVMHGRHFEDDSTEILRQAREERSAAL